MALADAEAITRQLSLALFMDAKLDLGAKRGRATSLVLQEQGGRRSGRESSVDDQTAKSPQLLAISFIQDAGAYVESARILDRVQANKLVAPKYFLLCHAIELLLKAHLAA